MRPEPLARLGRSRCLPGPLVLAVALVTVCLHTLGCDTASLTPLELQCEDGLDNDGDGRIDCLDADCATYPRCGKTARLCDPLVTAEVSCGQVISGRTVDGKGQINFYACQDVVVLPGAEQVYRFITPVRGTYHARVSAGHLVVLSANNTGCDPANCVADGTDVSFQGAPDLETFLVVDSAGAALDFELRLDCPEQLNGELLCGDQRDNDADTLVDCDDPDCADAPWCGGPAACPPTTLAVDCETGRAAAIQPLVGQADFYQCGERFEAMPLSETVARFVAPHPGEYRFWLGGDGATEQEIALIPGDADGQCRLDRCDAIGPEAVRLMGQDEVAFVSVEGPPAAAFELRVECPAPPGDGGPCQVEGTIGCNETVTVQAQGGGPNTYQCGANRESAWLGRDAAVGFTAGGMVDVSFDVTVTEGSGQKVSRPAWPHFLLKDAGAGCDPAQCSDLAAQTRATLLTGERVFVVADSGLGEELGEVQITATCHDPFSACQIDTIVACGKTVTLQPERRDTSAYQCGAETLLRQYGPEVAVSVSAAQDQWVSIIPERGDVYALSGAGCDPKSCTGVDRAITRKVAAGQSLAAAIEVEEPPEGEPAAPLTVTVECHDPTQLPACSATAALVCGAQSIPLAQSSQLDAYFCDGDLFGGLKGRDAVAGYTAVAPTTLRATLPPGVEGFFLRDVGQGCRAQDCVDSGREIEVTLDAGETAWLVIDQFLPAPGAPEGPGAIDVTVDCLPAFGPGQCKQEFVSCGATLAFDVSDQPSQVQAYRCGGGDGQAFVSTLAGPEVGVLFEISGEQIVHFSAPNGDVFLLDEACNAESCREANSDLALAFKADQAGQQARLMVDTYSASQTELNLTVECTTLAEQPSCTPTATVTCGDSVSLQTHPNGISAYLCGESAAFGSYDGPQAVAAFTAPQDMDLTVNMTAGHGFLLKETGGGCRAQDCSRHDPMLLQRSLKAGETVYIVGESSADAPLDTIGFNVSCGPPGTIPVEQPPVGVTCPSGGEIACGETAFLPAVTQQSAIYACGTESHVGLDGPEAAARITVPTDMEVTVTLSAGEGFLMAPGPTCAPAACVDAGNQELYALAKGGESLYLVVDSAASDGFLGAEVTVSCVDVNAPVLPTEPETCTADVDMACGETATLAAHPSQATAYTCGAVVYSELDGPEAVARFVAPDDLELTVALPVGLEGSLLLSAEGSCDPTTCVDQGGALFATLKKGDIAFIVVDSEAKQALSEVTLSLTCNLLGGSAQNPADGSCQSDTPLVCGQSQTVPTHASQAGAYQCGATVVSGLGGPEAVAYFTAPEAMEVVVTVPAGAEGVALLDAGAGCSPTACVDSGNTLFVTLNAGETVYLVADTSADTPLDSVTFQTACQSLAP